MSSALQFEVLDLRHFSAGSLRPLLEAESRVWSERLHWDYRGSADLLLQYLDSRVLPGYVAVENGRVTGYVFCVYEGHKAVIGDVFAMGAGDVESQVRNELLRHLLEMLQSSPGVTRVESQLLLHPHGSHRQVFEAADFETHERIFMEWPLEAGGAGARDGHRAAGIETRRWSDGDFAAAARLIADAYEGHQDSHINEQYRTVQGSHRFLHNIVRFPGCGYFDPEASRALVLKGSNELAGILLCSRVRDDVGHVTQICVAPQHRGEGFATLLMRECAANLEKRRFSLLTLTVTASNENAVSLYDHLGYVKTHRFDAMVWDKIESLRASVRRAG
jgi:ribosomal protein S18 acetylase RimI-like enzyme